MKNKHMEFLIPLKGSKKVVKKLCKICKCKLKFEKYDTNPPSKPNTTIC